MQLFNVLKSKNAPKGFDTATYSLARIYVGKAGLAQDK